MRLKLLFLCLFPAVLGGLGIRPAKAEILKTASVDCQKQHICLYWWPKLPDVKGWHSELSANRGFGPNGINTRIPNGSDFGTAGAIMYGEATYKSELEKGDPKIKSLTDLIAHDVADFAKDRDSTVSEAAPLKNGDGKVLRTVTFFRAKDQNWERVAYDEEGDFYLMFVVNAKNQKVYLESQAVFESMIGNYHK